MGGLAILLLALLPAAGNFAGGILAEILPATDKRTSRSLHAAAGVILAVVAVELMPLALARASGWIVVLAFAGGGLLFLLVDLGADALSARSGGAWMVYSTVGMDLLSDGIMVGTGAAVQLELALVLALGQVLADIPEGFASMASLRAHLPSRRLRLLLGAGFALPALLGAALGYWGLRGAGDAGQQAALMLTAGFLTTSAVEEILPLAHARREARWDALFLVGGFCLFTGVAVLLR